MSHPLAIANLLSVPAPRFVHRLAGGRAGTLQFASLVLRRSSFQEIFSTLTGREANYGCWWTEEERRDTPRLCFRLLDEKRVERLFLPFRSLYESLAETAAAEDRYLSRIAGVPRQRGRAASRSTDPR
jgi:hypothetical protein